ncbi:MAG TPA: UDP-N-acetylmuramoyl-L-alanine--D-glutamate ligase [Acidimicrobiia bacterium]|nr:UDP-N-acetylmuramoyl-L-alanine--D-glutamate ligase [Acidimicrobiia bacterium]
MSRILILGAGVSGLAAARLAVRSGSSVTLYDREPSADAYASGLSIASGPWDPVLLGGIDYVVASPGFSERSAPIVDCLEAGLAVLSEIEFASRHTATPMIAITGTNGKTTVTEATAMMLDQSGIDAPATGNIGFPLSDFVEGPHQALVVETSSFQLRFTESFHPVAAAVTNVAVDHLDWHGSASGYAAAKRNIYMNQTDHDFLVFDSDDAGATSLVADAVSEKFPISGRRLPEGGGGVDGDSLVVGDVSVRLDQFELNDPIHLANLAMSAALALWMGGSPAAVSRTLIEFRPGAHKRQIVAQREGITWIDDSKATNPHAALASIRAHDNVVLIAGGLAKGTDVGVLGREPNLSLVLGIGEAGPEIVAEAGDIGEFVGTLDEAVKVAAVRATAGDTVLLAPGCASFDQFGSYRERGDRFRQLVEDMERESAGK